MDAQHNENYLHPAAVRAMFDLATRTACRSAPALDLPDNRAVEGCALAYRTHAPERDAMMLVSLREAAQDGRNRAGRKAVVDYSNGRPALANLLVILTTIQRDSLTELVCHPGYVDDALRTTGWSSSAKRNATLTHAATRECVSPRESAGELCRAELAPRENHEQALPFDDYASTCPMRIVYEPLDDVAWWMEDDLDESSY
jgi:hypothetical protein